jgi:arsenical pump membrane protein
VLTFAAAAGATAILSLDATVVLLTPVVFATATNLRLRAKPHVYACAHLANSASTLLPVSNLTNLLAFSASGLTFAGFTALMALPWLVTIAIELVVFLKFLATDLVGKSDREPETTPVFALVVLALTLAGFGLGPLAGVKPVWVATAAALVLAVRGLARRTVRPWTLVIEASPLLCLFVLGLAVVVEAVSEHLLGGLLGTILPGSAGLPELLLTAVIAALLANLVNNLPATLILLSVLGSHPNTGVLLAVLLGVNIGTMDADEWAKTEAMPSGDEITRVRRIIDRMKGDLDEITEEERVRVDEAVAVVLRAGPRSSAWACLASASPYPTFGRGAAHDHQ